MPRAAAFDGRNIIVGIFVLAAKLIGLRRFDLGRQQLRLFLQQSGQHGDGFLVISGAALGDGCP